jgi:hypothetical protein
MCGWSPLGVGDGDEAEAGRAVVKGRREDRHVLLVGLVDDRILALGPAVLIEVLAEGAEQLAAAVRTRLELFEDLAVVSSQTRSSSSSISVS